nr:hypothetical protein [Tanacetum cinerariifolium]
RGVVIGITRPLSRVVTGATVRITTVRDLTSVVAMITTAAAATTTTTLAVTTGIPVMDVTKETGVISLTDLPILEEQAKNFQWGLRRSTLNHLMCMSYTDVAQVANAARNYEILHERDDDDTERPDKRGVVIGTSRPLSRVVTGVTVKITTVMDLTGVVATTTTAAATTTTLTVTTGIPVMDVTRETGVISPTDLPILVLSSSGL